MSNVDIIRHAPGEATEGIRQKLRAYILENFLFGASGDELKNDGSFLEKGIIDSTGILEIVNYVEGEFNIKVEDEEIVPENLDSVDRLAQYISRKTGA